MFREYEEEDKGGFPVLKVGNKNNIFEEEWVCILATYASHVGP
jgi:hypothetical protein